MSGPRSDGARLTQAGADSDPGCVRPWGHVGTRTAFPSCGRLRTQLATGAATAAAPQCDEQVQPNSQQDK